MDPLVCGTCGEKNDPQRSTCWVCQQGLSKSKHTAKSTVFTILKTIIYCFCVIGASCALFVVVMFVTCVGVVALNRP